jgi:hypothetical protein
MRKWIRLKRAATRAIHRVSLRGNAVFCACCGRSASRFLPRQICAFCGSRSRQRHLWLHLEKMFRRAETVLHFAPEECLQRPLSRLPGTTYVSADLKSTLVHVNVDLEQPEATIEQLGRGRFSIIIISHVLEHIRDDRKAMAALRGLVAPEGRVLVQVPFDPSRAETYEDDSIVTDAGRLAAFGQEDHVRLYGRDLVSRLEAAGFRVAELHPADICSPDAIERGHLGSDTIFFCSPV